jgi:hypothetical protein
MGQGVYGPQSSTVGVLLDRVDSRLVMTAGKVSAGLAGVAAIALSACDAGAPKQDMAFVEGCWVLRWNSDDSISMKTRIVPDKDGQAYRGVVREFGDASDPGQDGYEFIFSRDGRWLEMDNHAPDSVRRLSTAPRPRLTAERPTPEILGRFPDSERMAVFRFEGGDRVIVVRTGDSVGASVLYADGDFGQTYFGGRRETCD